jgi:hypothetical protein
MSIKCSRYVFRVQVGTIRLFGLHPALQDLVKKKDLHMIGTPSDRSNRLENPRKDDENRRALVLEARRKIYQEGYAMSNTQVEALLKPTSAVPTIVSRQTTNI